MQVKDSRVNLLEGNLINTIVKLGYPMALASIVQMLYNLADTFWLGKIGHHFFYHINWDRVFSHRHIPCFPVYWRQTGKKGTENGWKYSDLYFCFFNYFFSSDTDL